MGYCNWIGRWKSAGRNLRLGNLKISCQRRNLASTCTMKNESNIVTKIIFKRSVKRKENHAPIKGQSLLNHWPQRVGTPSCGWEAMAPDRGLCLCDHAPCVPAAHQWTAPFVARPKTKRGNSLLLYSLIFRFICWIIFFGNPDRFSSHIPCFYAYASETSWQQCPTHKVAKSSMHFLSRCDPIQHSLSEAFAFTLLQEGV